MSHLPQSSGAPKTKCLLDELVALAKTYQPSGDPNAWWAAIGGEGEPPTEMELVLGKDDVQNDLPSYCDEVDCEPPDWKPLTRDKLIRMAQGWLSRCNNPLTEGQFYLVVGQLDYVKNDGIPEEHETFRELLRRATAYLRAGKDINLWRLAERLEIPLAAPSNPLP